MQSRKIKGKLLLSSGLIYRAIVVCVNILFFKIGVNYILTNFGATVASLTWGAINMSLYYIYHYIFAKFFKLGVNGKKVTDTIDKGDMYSLFIGRWQCLPPHDGHLALFDVVRKEGKKILIAIRDTKISDSNPFTAEERTESLRKAVPDAKIIVIPDIEEVVYGRGVGYGIRELKLGKEIEAISATKIREGK